MRTRTPPRTKERYILDSIPKIFKGGEWIESIPENRPSAAKNGKSQMGGEGVSGRENGSGGRTDPMSTRYITIIGGQKYDKDALSNYLGTLSADTYAVIGEGRGAELNCERIYGELANLIPVDPDRYGKNARKINVEEVLCFAIDSPLLLVGEGERVKQARAWLKRTASRREVVELP